MPQGPEGRPPEKNMPTKRFLGKPNNGHEKRDPASFSNPGQDRVVAGRGRKRQPNAGAGPPEKR